MGAHVRDSSSIGVIRMDIWITRRLPKPEECDDAGRVLITNDEGNEHIAEWTGSRFEIKDLGWCESEKVEAWMSLPEPYRKDTDDECI